MNVDFFFLWWQNKVPPQWLVSAYLKLEFSLSSNRKQQMNHFFFYYVETYALIDSFIKCLCNIFCYDTKNKYDLIKFDIIKELFLRTSRNVMQLIVLNFLYLLSLLNFLNPL